MALKWIRSAGVILYILLCGIPPFWAALVIYLDWDNIDKSGEYDIDGTKLDRLQSTEGTGEAILLEGNLQQISPWWQQFPKRWVIVLLCFTAFLLCNMDRVNMSIAILPMSKEFNWNSATVGLIQSSFFWGYLLTQIAGGIWADKLGGKVVLGFGVVWWSIATILTPIAAKLGLPCLLVMRAFMGIGEMASALFHSIAATDT